MKRGLGLNIVLSVFIISVFLIPMASAFDISNLGIWFKKLLGYDSFGLSPSGSGNYYQCFDTDKGFNIYFPGTAISDFNGVKSDYCVNATAVYEARCIGHVSSADVVNCPGKCQYGRCVSENPTYPSCIVR